MALPHYLCTVMSELKVDNRNGVVRTETNVFNENQFMGYTLNTYFFAMHISVAAIESIPDLYKCLLNSQ